MEEKNRQAELKKYGLPRNYDFPLIKRYAMQKTWKRIPWLIAISSRTKLWVITVLATLFLMAMLSAIGKWILIPIAMPISFLLIEKLMHLTVKEMLSVKEKTYVEPTEQPVSENSNHSEDQVEKETPSEKQNENLSSKEEEQVTTTKVEELEAVEEVDRKMKVEGAATAFLSSKEEAEQTKGE